MSARRKSARSGPVGHSCLTCRQRCKKCDKARPICERCAVGGFVCLGYDNTGQNSASSGLERYTSVLRFSENPHDFDTVSFSHAPTSNASAELSLSGVEYLNTITPDDERNASRLSGMSTSNEFNHVAQLDTYIPQASISQTALCLSTLQRFRHPQSVTSNDSAGGLDLMNDRDLRAGSFQNITSTGRQFSQFNLPRNLSFEPYDMRYTVDFILSQYHRLTTLSFFGPNDQQVTGVSEAVSYRMRESDMTRWTMFLAMKTLAAILDGANATNLEGHIKWIARFEQQLDGLDSNDLGRLVGTLELAFLKSKIVHRPNTYQEVQNLAPKFLQIAFADSTLWPDSGRYPTSVSLTRILSSHRHELVHFVMLDSLCSLAYALPQAIEYDTLFSPVNIGVHLMEWIHGCPAELQHALVEINARCHGRTRAQPERDWRSIERQIKSWNPKVWSTLEEDSWKTVARLAVQESWRHTMLIYIYMGVCGVSSDDERVQESVHQVFRLIETAKNSYTPLVSIYIPVQYIVAGACARTEKHREIARERLGATLKDTIWLLNAADFVPVLDHLWHGAAANGQAIRWNDYAYSRQVALPIPFDSVHLE